MMITAMEYEMNAKKITTLTLLSVLVGLAGCGGSDTKDKYYSSDALNPTELAQVVAAIQAAKTTFDVVAYDGQGAIATSIEDGTVNRDIACRTGSYKVTANNKTSYAKDGLILNTNCTTNTSKWDGAIELECLDSQCNKSITTASGASWSDFASRVDLKINGDVLSDSSRDAFRGHAKITKDGKETSFDFTDLGLIQDYESNGVMDGFGQLRITDGANNRCKDGRYIYNISSDLVVEANSLRAIAGEIEIKDAKDRKLGVANFARDGGITVKTSSGATASISPTEFESYCGLGEAYRFSEF